MTGVRTRRWPWEDTETQREHHTKMEAETGVTHLWFTQKPGQRLGTEYPSDVSQGTNRVSFRLLAFGNCWFQSPSS